MTEKMTVLQRINQAAHILQLNPWIKDMSNSQFKSVDIDQIRREVGKAETEAGLVVMYTELEFEPFPMGGKVYNKVKADLTYYSIDDEDFSSPLVFHRSAIGYDSLDKGFNKAESMLYKNHYKGLYHIGERQDDPDQYSREEYDLIEAFRYAARYSDPKKPDYKPMYGKFMKLVEEGLKAVEDEKRAQKAEERKKAAESFGKRPATTEADVTRTDDEDRTAAWAEKKADELRPDLIQFYQENPQCDIIKERIKDHGQISDWRPGIVI
jgi:hypothetical protein